MIEADRPHHIEALEVIAPRHVVPVPRDHVEDGVSLGSWVKLQRSRFRSGLLSAEERDALEAVPGWTWEQESVRWEEGFARLRTFVDREHHARVPDRWIEDGFPLGTWARSQRRVFRDGRMPEDRIRRFDALPGWSWDPFGDAWETGFRHLAAFVEREGLISHVDPVQYSVRLLIPPGSLLLDSPALRPHLEQPSLTFMRDQTHKRRTPPRCFAVLVTATATVRYCGRLPSL